MTDFDALLKRSFAEAPEPADDGFTVQVNRRVVQREAQAKLRQNVWAVGMAAAGAAIAYGLYALMQVFGQEILATAGLEVAQAYGALSSAPSVSGQAQSLVQSLGAGITQILLITAALAGGAVAYRATQD
ncbi:MAG: hypothetical protein JNK94_10355 [Hyphomonadaceae bacterium]|nr:hypothetical protein [Hyphomonadaceae bacterium]